MKRKKLESGFDSKEEEIFFSCLQDLVKADVLISFERCTQAMTLFEGARFGSVVMRRETYTPDFILYGNAGHPKFEDWVKNAPKWCFKPSGKESPLSIVECKPVFDQHNMERTFVSKQKHIYDKFGLYICIVHPTVFKKNFKEYWGIV
jgi:hypothetical protein